MQTEEKNDVCTKTSGKFAIIVNVAFVAFRVAEMLPIKPLAFNDVADVADFRSNHQTITITGGKENHPRPSSSSNSGQMEIAVRQANQKIRLKNPKEKLHEIVFLQTQTQACSLTKTFQFPNKTTLFPHTKQTHPGFSLSVKIQNSTHTLFY